MAKHFVTNLAGTVAKTDLAKLSQSRSVNMYPSTEDMNQGIVQLAMRSIKGMDTFIEMKGHPRGMFTVSRGYDEQLTTYCVYDNWLYVIKKDKAYKIGQMADTNSICHFCETGGYGDAHPHLVIVDGERVYAVNTGLEIADQKKDFKTIDLPYRSASDKILIRPTHCAYMYGYLIINDCDTDAFYTSYQYPFEITKEDGNIDYDLFMCDEDGKYPGTGYVTYSEWQPDKTLALCSNGSRLYTFGDRSYQVFQYNDDVNMPFTSPDTAAAMIGIKAIDSLAHLGPYTMWLGSSDIGNNGLYLNTGAIESTRVSTPNIEREWASYVTVTDAVATIWQENQHIFYSINFPSAGHTWVYDIKENMWHERSSLDEHNNNTIWRYGYATLDANGDLLYLTEDAIVKQSKSSWKEHDGRPIVRTRVGGIVHSNGSNFFIDSLTIIMNNGQIENFIGQDAKVSMRFCADGQWTDVEVIDVGASGEYDYDCTFYNFGMARYFTIELSTADDFDFSLYGLRMDIAEAKW